VANSFRVMIAITKNFVDLLINSIDVINLSRNITQFQCGIIFYFGLSNKAFFLSHQKYTVSNFGYILIWTKLYIIETPDFLKQI
jgi:hypothetical protein